jgi:hypothetical protein
VRKKKHFVLDQLDQPRQDKKLFYRPNEPNEQAKEGSLSYVLLKSSFASVSTVISGHLSLVSMFLPLKWLSSRQLEDSDQDLGAALAWHMRRGSMQTSRKYTRIMFFLLVICSSV